jgi:two-component system invasion response regulator UvrY
MKKINLTIINGGLQRFPGCADILESCPQFRIITRAGGVHEPGAWSAMGQSDVVLLDEAVIEQDGSDAVRSIVDCYPLLKVLLILDDECPDRVMEAIALGVAGVMGRSAIRSMLHKAIPALYAGESWISRDLAYSLRKQLNQGKQNASGATQSTSIPGRWKFN